jgi:hypothetical protein
VIFLTDQTVDVTISDGTVHLPENMGEETAEFIMVEFKDRDAFQK